MKLQPVFETCEPRPEVLSGDLRDEIFAARLLDVIEGKADPVYGDPAKFFHNTYPTDGLRSLVDELMGRLSGAKPNNAPFVRLETSFGGGKTHNLIALYHLAKGHREEVPADLLPSDWIPSEPWPVAGIVGSDLEPASGIEHGKIRTRTPWGEIAWQIGRDLGDPERYYGFVRESEESMTAPGIHTLEKVLGDGPVLVMFDEAAQFLRRAKTVQTANGKSDLAEQTVAFLMSLIEYAASRPRVGVVLTLADSSDAFGAETESLRMELAEAKRVSARQERVISPTGEMEISRIVTHRLFRKIDEGAASKASEVYRAYYRELDRKKIDIPQTALRAEYRKDIERDYPFHPELLVTLNRKTATIPNFQKTRGALRLLARVVRRVWDVKPADASLIATHHLDLGDRGIAGDLTSRLERPTFTSVIDADIVSTKKGSPAHAEKIDREWKKAGKPPFARRLATTIFLHSLTQGTATGVEEPELLLSVAQPGDDPDQLLRTIARMLGEDQTVQGGAFWFLHWDTRRYRFKTEPSLEKVVHDELHSVGTTKAKTELEERIRKIWKKGSLKPLCFPEEPADVPDDADLPKLAILHYDAAHVTAQEEEPPELATRLFDHAGSMHGYRTYKNNLMFLVADADHTKRMVDVARRFLAVERIVRDGETLKDFSQDQQQTLRGMHEAAELEVRVAITRAYRYLFYPAGDASRRGGLARETLPIQDQGRVEKDQTEVVFRVLEQLEKVLTADSPPMAPAFVKAKAWIADQESVTTADLQREFAKRIGLRMLLDPGQLKKTIRTGCRQGLWVYFDTREQVGYGRSSPDPLVELSEDALLYLPEAAASQGVRIKGEELDAAEPCPLCGNDPCTCEATKEGRGTGTAEEDRRLVVHRDGPPAQAFQAVADAFQDEKRETIGVLVMTLDGTDRQAAQDLRSLGLAVPQLGKGRFRVEQHLTAEFGQAPEGDVFEVRFRGGWERYKRLKQTGEAFAQEADRLRVETVLEARFEEGLPVTSDRFQSMRDVFTQLGLGRVRLEARDLDKAGQAGSR